MIHMVRYKIQIRRSDAKLLLLTVNPKTGTILMTSIPRDYYVELVRPEDAS